MRGASLPSVCKKPRTKQLERKLDITRQERDILKKDWAVLGRTDCRSERARMSKPDLPMRTPVRFFAENG